MNSEMKNVFHKTQTANFKLNSKTVLMQSSKQTANKETLVTCQKCKKQTNLSSLNATLHRQSWYHLSCWKELVGKS